MTKLQLKHSTKDALAVGVCVTSIIVACFAMRAAYDLAEIVMALSVTWSVAATFASRLPRYYNKPLDEIFQIAKRGGLKDSSVAITISLGGMIFLAIWFVVIFRQLASL